MASQSQIVKRLRKLAAMLVAEETVSKTTYKKEIKKLLGDDCDFCDKTLQRDIAKLKKDHKATINYCHEERSYILSGSLSVDALAELDPGIIIRNSQLAKSMLPEELRKDNDDEINSVIASLDADEFERAAINSLIVPSKTKVTIDPDIFDTVFNAWRATHAIDVVYKNLSGEQKERRVDPHVISYHEYIWYIKGFCHASEGNRTFAIHRIVEAEDTGKSYTPDKKLIEEVENNGLFSFQKIEGAKVRCNKNVRSYILEQAEALNYTIDADDDDVLVVSLPPIDERELIRWVLSERGNVQILEPANLRSQVLSACDVLTQTHRDS